MKKCKKCNSIEHMKKLEFGIYHYCHSTCYKCQIEKKHDYEDDSEVVNVEESIEQLERLFHE